MKNLLFTDEELKNNSLIEMEKLLQSNNKSLFDFPLMPILEISSSVNLKIIQFMIN